MSLLCAGMVKRSLMRTMGGVPIVDEEGMKQFRFGVDARRWREFSEACNINAGREFSPTAVEARAFYLWSDAIDAIFEHYKVREDQGPVLLMIWMN
jgi:hypothetical protein